MLKSSEIQSQLLPEETFTSFHSSLLVSIQANSSQLPKDENKAIRCTVTHIVHM